jgi:hypothetical protein
LEDAATQQLARVANAAARQPAATGQQLPAMLAGSWQLDEASTTMVTLSGYDYRLGRETTLANSGKWQSSVVASGFLRGTAVTFPEAWAATPGHGTKLRFEPVNMDPGGRTNIPTRQVWTLKGR